RRRRCAACAAACAGRCIPPPLRGPFPPARGPPAAPAASAGDTSPHPYRESSSAYGNHIWHKLRSQKAPHRRAEPRSGSAEELFGDGLELQVGRALVDLPDLRVAVQLLNGIVLDEPVAAEQVDRERGDTLGDLRREDLAH